ASCKRSKARVHAVISFPEFAPISTWLAEAGDLTRLDGRARELPTVCSELNEPVSAHRRTARLLLSPQRRTCYARPNGRNRSGHLDVVLVLGASQVQLQRLLGSLTERQRVRGPGGNVERGTERDRQPTGGCRGAHQSQSRSRGEQGPRAHGRSS